MSSCGFDRDGTATAFAPLRFRTAFAHTHIPLIVTKSVGDVFECVGKVVAPGVFDRFDTAF